jgi:uncharacterized protein YqgQ
MTKSVDDALEELIKYASLDGTEWGEMIMAAQQLWHYRDYLSAELASILDQEILAQHEWAVNNLQIVEEKVTETKTYRRLEQL